MTLKVVSQENDGFYKTDLFVAERISHREGKLNDVTHPMQSFDDVVSQLKPDYVVSVLTNTDTTQNFWYSWVILHGEEDDVKPLLISAPATCYVMVGGKTIDTFRLDFINDDRNIAEWRQTGKLD